MTEKDRPKSNLVNIGQITGVFGVKGWLKVHSDTQPRENIFNYSPWYLKTRYGVKAVEIVEGKPHGNTLVAHIKGIDDRDQARELTKVTVAIDRSQIPELDSDEYYWYQLEGLKVISVYGEQPAYLGSVSHLLETGANDVLVVKPDAESIDDRERLIPYLPGEFINSISLEDGEMQIDWDPEF